MNEQDYQFECDFSVSDDVILVTEDDDGDQAFAPLLDRFPENRVPTHLLYESILQARCNYSIHDYKKVADDPALLADHLTVTLEERRLFALLASEPFQEALNLLKESLTWFENGNALNHELHTHRAEIENGTADMSRQINGFLCVVAYAQILFVLPAG